MRPDNSIENTSTSSRASDEELRQIMPLAPPRLRLLKSCCAGGGGGGDGSRKRLLKQLSMCETPRDAAWERRRQQMLRRSDAGGGCGCRGEECCGGSAGEAAEQRLTDDDLSELKGSIELGFGFNEEDGQALCETLPALDLYFAVNRQLSASPASTPRSRASFSSSSSLSIGRSSPMGSPKADSDSWKICNPGDDPQQVKTKLRHWAQAVACSVMQSYELSN